jgi:hypothetical protein
MLREAYIKTKDLKDCFVNLLIFGKDSHNRETQHCVVASCEIPRTWRICGTDYIMPEHMIHFTGGPE